MERTTSLTRAKEIMGINFIGPIELKSIEKKMGIYIPDEVLKNPPLIHFDENMLKKLKNDYILILGMPYFKDKTPLTIVKMREHFGCDPEKSEPCFYNQDWYLKEKFANATTIELKWYLIRKNVFEEERGKDIEQINLLLKSGKLPSALLTSFTFFSYYYLNSKELLWKYDYIWCQDRDHNGDQIYVGKYLDIEGINKNGFNIHRFLQVRSIYSFVDTIM